MATERESLLADIRELDKAIGTLQEALEAAKQTHRRFGRVVAHLGSIEQAFLDVRGHQTRVQLNESLDALEAARHRVRTGIVALGLSEGLSIGQLGRKFEFSRQLASRYAKEARSDSEENATLGPDGS